MKLRKYLANNVQEAMYQVKQDLGRDAIILSTRRIRSGGIFGLFSKNMIEVTAASDIQAADSGTLPEAKPSGLEHEVRELKSLLLGFQKNPVRETGRDTHLLNKMKMILEENEVEAHLINEMCLNALERLNGKELKEEIRVRSEIKQEIIKHMAFFKNRNTTRPHIIAFVGPTGVGKTTSIAKLAADLILNQKKNIALITTDTYRIAAVEQLKTYADIMNIPIEVVYTTEDLKISLSKYKDFDSLLIDTSGISPKNKFQMIELKGLLETCKPQDVFLVMSASTRTKDLKKIYDDYKMFDVNGLMFTKLDETHVYGALLNITNYARCPLEYITTGQTVPDDIERAELDKVAKIILGECGYGRSS
jgi:flagellar biosynthesis protein FlhF